MANKKFTIAAAITRLKITSELKISNHKCTTVIIQDPHVSKILNLAMKTAGGTRTSTSTTTSTATSMPASGPGTGGGY